MQRKLSSSPGFFFYIIFTYPSSPPLVLLFRQELGGLGSTSPPLPGLQLEQLRPREPLPQYEGFPGTNQALSGHCHSPAAICALLHLSSPCLTTKGCCCSGRRSSTSPACPEEWSLTPARPKERAAWAQSALHGEFDIQNSRYLKTPPPGHTSGMPLDCFVRHPYQLACSPGAASCLCLTLTFHCPRFHPSKHLASSRSSTGHYSKESINFPFTTPPCILRGIHLSSFYPQLPRTSLSKPTTAGTSLLIKPGVLQKLFLCSPFQGAQLLQGRVCVRNDPRRAQRLLGSPPHNSSPH